MFIITQSFNPKYALSTNPLKLISKVLHRKSKFASHGQEIRAQCIPRQDLLASLKKIKLLIISFTLGFPYESLSIYFVLMFYAHTHTYVNVYLEIFIHNGRCKFAITHIWKSEDNLKYQSSLSTLIKTVFCLPLYWGSDSSPEVCTESTLSTKHAYPIFHTYPQLLVQY